MARWRGRWARRHPALGTSTWSWFCLLSVFSELTASWATCSQDLQRLDGAHLPLSKLCCPNRNFARRTGDRQFETQAASFALINCMAPRSRRQFKSSSDDDIDKRSAKLSKSCKFWTKWTANVAYANLAQVPTSAPTGAAMPKQLAWNHVLGTAGLCSSLHFPLDFWSPSPPESLT